MAEDWIPESRSCISNSFPRSSLSSTTFCNTTHLLNDRDIKKKNYVTDGERNGVAPQERMFILISWFWIARSIYLAAQLGIADRFDDAPKTIAQLAAETETDPWSLYRLMRDLASVDIYRSFRSMFCTYPLATDVPGSMRYAAIAQNGLRPLFRLDQRIEQKTGEPAFDAATGMSVSDHAGVGGGRERTEGILIVVESKWVWTHASDSDPLIVQHPWSGEALKHPLCYIGRYAISTRYVEPSCRIDRLRNFYKVR